MARSLYEDISGLPLVCPHGHVPPELLADDAAFLEPTSLLILPDHYILRMLYSQGIPLEELGIATIDGTSFETDPRAVWQHFASNYHLFLGTPTRAWLDYVFYNVFDLRIKLNADSALRIYEQIADRLADPSFRPRALFDRFNIEVLTTTDAASDDLRHHRAIRESGWGGNVIPCFRPDALFKIDSPAWGAALSRLIEMNGSHIANYSQFIDSIERRRIFFKENGATSTDHGVTVPFTQRLRADKAEAIFERALAGSASADDQAIFEAHMLMEMARMSIDDGLVMQLHAGSLRNHNRAVLDRFGPDKGGDIPIATEYTRNLHDLLNAYGNNPRFRLIVFTLDESTYSRELAPLASHYPAMRLGPAWWFFDSIEGMKRYREQTTETAGIYNTAGFNDDTRAFLSIPARHDLSRRIDANYVAGLVARHQVDLSDARVMVRAMAYDLARSAYRFE